ncbi:MAG: hypothetical protein IJ147_11825 [Lachnospiraceae bacterium]|nr:hypothetical protein [Lachnospiraceae bacterium]MBQ8118728.1 hypothetical protein [Lachnospiraceae bacterium]
MSTIAKSSLRFFLKDGIFSVDRQPVEDCVLEGEELKVLELKNCTCRNMTFRNAVTESVIIENCAFINCRFENTVKGSEGVLLRVTHTSFTECEFGKLTLIADGEESGVEKVHFSHCKFEESEMTVKGDAQALKFYRCEARDFSYKGEALSDSKIEEMDLMDVKLEIRAQGNQFEKTAFQNVELIGTTEKNFFKECDMKGYHFTEKK